MRFRPLLPALMLLLASCEQARRYPSAVTVPAAPSPPTAKKGPPIPAHWAWMRPIETPHDIPIEFVPPAAPGWAALPRFWSQFPPPAAGTRTAHLGLPPMQAVAALVMADQMEIVRVKVPLGLPDPNPLVPAANPPTYGKWRLGKKLFFEPILQSGGEAVACASCHHPVHGFTERRARAAGGVVNTPSLLNAVYNRHQFWDGRVTALEEVIVRSLADEAPPADRPASAVTHAWSGLVTTLARDESYRFDFDRVFGIPQPTQDAIAKALATYVRTILSGDSLYDRAEVQRLRAKADTLSRAHFLAALDEAALESLGGAKMSKDAAASELDRGFNLFHSTAGCAACHRGSLFTDHDFHNVGLNTDDSLPPPDRLTGRITAVPVGLKQMRLVGAYRTPSLRGLPRTAPYFHNGQMETLREVVTFFNRGIAPTPYLADALRDGAHERRLGLTDDQLDALVLFLRSLDGGRVDPVVATP